MSMVTDYLRNIGANGGKAAAANMTPAQRRARAKKAAKASAAIRARKKKESSK
jgi:hypothetical protein